MRRSVPLTATAVIVLSLAGLSACDSETDPGSPVPTDGDPVGGGDDTSLTSSLPPQMTAAPNPDAGGDGAPSPDG